MHGLPTHYGLVVATGSAGVLVNIGLAAAVVAARHRYRVKFPNMHSPDAPKFNWTLQVQLDYATEAPFFYFALLTGGLSNPRVASAAGVAYILSRSLGRLCTMRYHDDGSEDKAASPSFDWSSLIGGAAFGVLAAASCNFALVQLRP